MNRFLTNNSSSMKMWRTIFQGIVGVIIANIDLIVGTFTIPAEYKPMVVAIVMAILSPIMAELGYHTVEVATNEEIIEGAD